jgi:hypothetical protein
LKKNICLEEKNDLFLNTSVPPSTFAIQVMVDNIFETKKSQHISAPQKKNSQHISAPQHICYTSRGRQYF